MFTSNLQPLGLGKVIIAEDDMASRKGLVKYLTIVGYDVTGVGSALEFYQQIAVHPYQIAILDIGLPDQSGISLCEYIRNNTNMRIVMLTGRTAMDDKLAAYESGADIYLVKPVDFRELAASVNNLLKRNNIVLQLPNQQPRTNDAELTSSEKKKLWRLVREDWHLCTPDGKRIKLTSKEFEFMSCFAANSHNTIPRKEILSILEYEHNEYGKRALESLVHRLRLKTEINGACPIKTVFGVGFSFTEELVIDICIKPVH